MTYSLDFRLKALAVKEKEGLSFAKTAERFYVGVASVVRWARKPEPQTNRNKPATKINMEALKQDILLYPDAYQYERAERLHVSATGIWYAVQRLGVTYKKNSSPSQGRLRKTLCLLSETPRISRSRTSYRSS
jgi:transposase